MAKYFRFLFISTISMAISSCSDATNACFTLSSPEITAGSTLTVDGSCSEMTTLYQWNFGDGSDDTVSNNPIMNHTFLNPGTFFIELTAVRKCGNGFVKRGEPTHIKTLTVN